MKLSLLIATCLAAIASMPGAGEAAFYDYFVDQTLRIDYQHLGDADTDVVSIDRIYRYGTWAGSLVNLVDDLNYGAYYHKIYDAATVLIVEGTIDLKRMRNQQPCPTGAFADA